MAKNDYRAVLRDLKERRAKLDAAIEVVEGVLGIQKEKPTTAPVISPATVEQNGYKNINLPDASYEVLKEAGTPLHARDIAHRVNETFGKSTNFNSIAASLPTERGHRFKNIGGNTFKLTEWPE